MHLDSIITLQAMLIFIRGDSRFLIVYFRAELEMAGQNIQSCSPDYLLHL